jgi:isobutyryl-CoA mutase
MLTLAETGRLPDLDRTPSRRVPVLGITGTGGSGKSSLTDELVRRFRRDQEDKLRIAVLAVDPSRRRGGGALLGDRIRMNALDGDRVFFRSMATRGAGGRLPERLADAIAVLRAAAFDLVIVETPGIGQGDADIVPTALYHHLRDLLAKDGLAVGEGRLTRPVGKTSTRHDAVLPSNRVRYLAEIAETVCGHHADTERWAELARRRQHLRTAHEVVGEPVAAALEEAERALPGPAAELLDTWPRVVEEYSGDELVVRVRDRELRTPLTRKTLSGNEVRRVALPRWHDHGDLLRFLRAENLPGRFPFTAGVFPFKRDGEDPARMFAGEGDAFRTNRRFHLLSEHSTAKRLSTAFDSVTLYGRDPDTRPDVYGKVGTSGVSIATLEDMKALYAGFDLCAPTTSVSMTINGPAPTILAYFLNTAIDQQVQRFAEEHGREPGDQEHEQIAAFALANVRGTVQADILKEDQGQNTCIFSTEFSLRMMADVQEWFIRHEVRNFYSVSISGYHIAEAGANPISQLAFTLANGFTYVEAYLARGMAIDDFAPNLSFFFSNGMDAEYTVIGRVARRIWAIAMRDRYGANERSQKLKYHVQTSGRSLHAQEMDFNDIRTTLQALCALYDNANSLHTNAFDEAVTTPTEASVRRAMAIQLIIGKEWGLSLNENPLQGSFVVDELTDLVEEAVLAEFDRIAERGGVLGAMETGYQRGRIKTSRCSTSTASTTGRCRSSGSTRSFARVPRSRWRSSWPGRPRRRSAASSTGSTTSTPATPPPPRPRCGGCRTSPPAGGTCSTS